MPFLYWQLKGPLKTWSAAYKKRRNAIKEALAIEAGFDVASKQKKLKALDDALAQAKKVDLHTNDDLGGELLMGVLNECRGVLENELASKLEPQRQRKPSTTPA